MGEPRLDPETNATSALGASNDADFVLNEFGETVSYPSGAEPLHGVAQPELAVPAAIGRYEIRGILGRGGFGAVYRGYDPQLDRQVAIKVPLLRPTQAQAELFPQEARKLAQLKHPSIVTVHDVGVHDGV